jgi:hypothetical protein
MPEIQKFIDEVASYRGTRWKDHARIPHKRLDCVGLVICGGRNTGFFHPDFDYQDYTRFAVNFSLTDTMSRFMTKKATKDVRTGDILCHRDEIFPCHVSVYWDRPGYGPSIIHSFLGGRRRVTFDPYSNWQSRTLAFCFELPGAN